MSENVQLKGIQSRDSFVPSSMDSGVNVDGHSNPAFAGSVEELDKGKKNAPRQRAGRPSETNLLDENDIAVVENGADPPPAYEASNKKERVPGRYEMWVTNGQMLLRDGYTTHETWIWRSIGLFLLGGYIAFFIGAMIYNFEDEGAHRLLGVTVFAAFCSMMYILTRIYPEAWDNFWDWFVELFEKRIWKKWLKWIVYGVLALTLILYVLIDVSMKNPYNLVSAGGILFFILAMYITSYNPARVKWRPVLWGLGLQLILALFILRTKFGFQVFDWIGTRVSEFLEHTDKGAQFVFGDAYMNHFFAFKILPVVIFFSTVTSILYYLGAIQVVIRLLSAVMQFLMGTTAAESLNAAGNIFIGQTEAPLLIRRLLPDMTRSELHAVMTGGFATIAGSVFGAYVAYGVPANHLLSASVMSAPAALAMSKLFYPETEESKTTAKDVQTMEKPDEVNVIQAASNGASASISLVANIAANLIAFLAILQFLDSTLTWCGHRVGLNDPELTFELICSYVFWPLAFLMGADRVDCRNVARLIGIKTFLNEFVAYSSLHDLLENEKTYQNLTAVYGNLTIVKNFDDWYVKEADVTLKYGLISDRSTVISTYALCGFANFGSIGIMLGALGAMAPSRKTDLSQIVMRAMIAGNVACFLTACFAGLLYEEF